MKRIVSGIAVTPLEFYSGAPIGTPIARVVVLIQPSGSFGGSLTVTGTNKTNFKPIKNADGTFTLLSATKIPANWSPSIYLVAAWSAMANNNYVAGPYTFGAEPTPLGDIAPPAIRRRRKAVSALSHTMILIAP